MATYRKAALITSDLARKGLRCTLAAGLAVLFAAELAHAGAEPALRILTNLPL